MIDEDLEDEFDEFDDDHFCKTCDTNMDVEEIYDDLHLCVDCLVKHYRVLDWDNKQMRARIDQLETMW
jgi:hypothetical protein